MHNPAQFTPTRAADPRKRPFRHRPNLHNPLRLPRLPKFPTPPAGYSQHPTNTPQTPYKRTTNGPQTPHKLPTLPHISRQPNTLTPTHHGKHPMVVLDQLHDRTGSGRDTGRFHVHTNRQAASVWPRRLILLALTAYAAALYALGWVLPPPLPAHLRSLLLRRPRIPGGRQPLRHRLHNHHRSQAPRLPLRQTPLHGPRLPPLHAPRLRPRQTHLPPPEDRRPGRYSSGSGLPASSSPQSTSSSSSSVSSASTSPSSGTTGPATSTSSPTSSSGSASTPSSADASPPSPHSPSSPPSGSSPPSSSSACSSSCPLPPAPLAPRRTG